MLKLHHLDRSPFGWKVRLVLEEKQAPYKLVIPENKSEDPAFLKLNPFRLTPVLELEDGATIYESTVINEYIEERFPEPAMLPKDPYERARIRMIEDTTDQYVYVRKKADEVDHKLLEASRIKLHEHLTRLESELAGRTYFGGGMFSLADAALVPPLTASMKLLSVLPDKRYPLIASWSARVVERASYIASAPKEPLRIRD
jgi:RNA polymerase-associated protein